MSGTERQMGIEDFDCACQVEDTAPDEVVFAATCSIACVISPAMQPRIPLSCAQPAARYGLSGHVIISAISRGWT